MDHDQLKVQWVELSGPWIKESRHGRNINREGVLDKPMLEACGDLRGLRVLDSGCGEGRFCRMVAARGAEYVLGVDLCEPMIGSARELQSGKDEYRLADVQDLGFLDAASFDVAISYLNQCDLADFDANTREIARVLRPGGKFIVANLHPMRSAVGAWHKNEVGAKQHVILDRYFDEGPRYWKLFDIEVTNFHRSLQTYVRAYRAAGFTIDAIIEPTAEDLVRYPELEDERRVPNFIIFVLQKIAA